MTPVRPEGENIRIVARQGKLHQYISVEKPPQCRTEAGSEPRRLLEGVNLLSPRVPARVPARVQVRARALNHLAQVQSPVHSRLRIPAQGLMQTVPTQTIGPEQVTCEVQLSVYIVPVEINHSVDITARSQTESV